MQKTENSLSTAMRRTKKADSKMLEQQKELVQAENLDENELKQISEEAGRIMNKKVKDMQKKVEGSLIEMLQQECHKLGVEIEKQRSDNNALRTENT